MPKRIDPRTRRACKKAVTISPKKNTIMSGEANCTFIFTQVPGSGITRCVNCRPIKAMNSPMPTAMPLRMLGLMASMSFSRTPSMRKQQKQHAGIEDHAQADLPGSGRVELNRSGFDLCVDHYLGGGQEAENEEEIFAHARGLGDRISGVKAHDDRGQRGREAGGRGDGAEIHACFDVEHSAREHRRLHDNDVGHGQKGRHPGEQFGADRGFIFRKAKKSVEHINAGIYPGFVLLPRCSSCSTDIKDSRL